LHPYSKAIQTKRSFLHTQHLHTPMHLHTHYYSYSHARNSDSAFQTFTITGCRRKGQWYCIWVYWF